MYVSMGPMKITCDGVLPEHAPATHANRPRIHLGRESCRTGGRRQFIRRRHYVYVDDLKAWLKKHPEFVPNRVVTAQPQRVPKNL
jgi:hypothetical protein